MPEPRKTCQNLSFYARIERKPHKTLYPRACEAARKRREPEKTLVLYRAREITQADPTKPKTDEASRLRFEHVNLVDNYVVALSFSGHYEDTIFTKRA